MSVYLNQPDFSFGEFRDLLFAGTSHIQGSRRICIVLFFSKFQLNVAIHFMFVYMVYFVEIGIKPFEYSHFIGWVKIFGYFI